MKIKKIISIALTVVITASVPFCGVNGAAATPPKTRVYKTSDFTSWAEFKNYCDENNLKISQYPKKQNPSVNGDGMLVIGGSNKQNMIIEFPNPANTSDAKYPSNGISGNMVVRQFVDLKRCPALFYSNTYYESCPELTWAKDHQGNPVTAYNLIKFTAKVDGNSGIKIGYYPDVFYYDHAKDTVFANGTVSVGYSEIWNDSSIDYSESTEYLGKGDYYLKNDSVILNFHLYYKDVYNTKTEKYETKLILDVKGSYDIYENQSVNSNPRKIETRTFETRNEITPYNRSYYENKTMGIGSYSNITNSRREEYFSDITVEYDLSAYYKPAAEKFDNTYLQRISVGTTVADLEKVRTDYIEAAEKLDSNIREYIAYDEVLSSVDKKIGNVITGNYNAKWSAVDKTDLTALNNQLNEFLTEYASYSNSVKQYIDKNTITERLEDAIAKLKSDYNGETAEVTVSDVTYNSVSVKALTGYEYTAVEKSVMDKITESTELTETEKHTAVRRAYNWRTDNMIKDLKPETEYYIFQRVAKTDSVNAGPVKSVTVKTLYRPGDLNHDGVFDSKDVSYLVNAIVGNEVLELEVSDFNGDNSVNIIDVLYLKKILLGYKGYTFK